MREWTWSEIKEKIQDDVDLQEEDFIDETELLAYANEAIDDVEAEIHTLYEDYFLTSGALTLTADVKTVTLPTDIYAWKIRKIIFDDGSQKYPIKKLKRIESIPDVQSGDLFRYLLRNDSTDGMQLYLYPTPTATDSSSVTIWYIRNARRLTADATICDIPEFVNYVIQHMKVRCYEKEGHPNLAQALAERERLKILMIETLENREDDEDDEVEADFSHYQDHE